MQHRHRDFGLGDFGYKGEAPSIILVMEMIGPSWLTRLSNCEKMISTREMKTIEMNSKARDSFPVFTIQLWIA